VPRRASKLGETPASAQDVALQNRILTASARTARAAPYARHLRGSIGTGAPLYMRST